MKKVSLLGSTGSMGTQTLDVIKNLRAAGLNIEVAALTANSNLTRLMHQIDEFKPKLVVVGDEGAAQSLREGLTHSWTEVQCGHKAICHAAALDDVDITINCLVGSVGLLPTISAVKAGKAVALANKETLVAAGELVMSLAKAHNIDIIPMDSEHNAIFQCLKGNELNNINTIYLTASGGPLRGLNPEQLPHVTKEQALNHPNWDMGNKITIDSATMMNKGLEVIEARWLFDIPHEKIKVLVHPQSVVHSMVEFDDGQTMAQLGPPDMRLPIQYALSHPRRLHQPFARLNWAKISELNFYEPDNGLYPCLGLCYEALTAGGLYPCVINAANECAVDLFLNDKIPFMGIARLVQGAMQDFKQQISSPSLDDILAADAWARENVLQNMKRGMK